MTTLPVPFQNIKIIAHRGLSALECENTCAAFVAAGNRSYYGIESDVHRTADGVFVMIHDNDTARVANGLCLPVERSTHAQLQEIVLTAPFTGVKRTDYKIPTLQEYLGICKRYGKKAILEIKPPFTDQDLQALITQVKQAEYLADTVFISFDLNYLNFIREMLPEQGIQFLTGSCDDAMLAHLIQHRMGLDIAHSGLTKELVNALHKAGLPVNCWTVDDVATAKKMADMGVDMITSNILE